MKNYNVFEIYKNDICKEIKYDRDNNYLIYEKNIKKIRTDFNQKYNTDIFTDITYKINSIIKEIKDITNEMPSNIEKINLSIQKFESDYLKNI